MIRDYLLQAANFSESAFLSSVMELGLRGDLKSVLVALDVIQEKPELFPGFERNESIQFQSSKNELLQENDLLGYSGTTYAKSLLISLASIRQTKGEDLPSHPFEPDHFEILKRLASMVLNGPEKGMWDFALSGFVAKHVTNPQAVTVLAEAGATFAGNFGAEFGEGQNRPNVASSGLLALYAGNHRAALALSKVMADYDLTSTVEALAEPKGQAPANAQWVSFLGKSQQNAIDFLETIAAVKSPGSQVSLRMRLVRDLMNKGTAETREDTELIAKVLGPTPEHVAAIENQTENIGLKNHFAALAKTVMRNHQVELFPLIRTYVTPDYTNALKHAVVGDVVCYGPKLDSPMAIERFKKSIAFMAQRGHNIDALGDDTSALKKLAKDYRGSDRQQRLVALIECDCDPNKKDQRGFKPASYLKAGDDRDTWNHAIRTHELRAKSHQLIDLIKTAGLRP